MTNISEVQILEYFFLNIFLIQTIVLYLYCNQTTNKMKKLTMEFPVITFIDIDGTEKIDKQKTLDKAKELIQLLKQLNLRFENED